MSENTITPEILAITASPVREMTYVGPSWVLVYAVAILTLGAALIPLAVTPQHFEEYLPYGLFFLAAGAGQIALAVALVVAPSRRLFIVGLAASVGLIAPWALSRTVGVPIGPDGAWQPETMGFTDIICSFLELVAAPLFLILSLRGPRLRHRRPVRVALATAPTFLLVALLTFVGTGTARNDMPVSFNAAPAVAGQHSTSVTTLTEAPGPGPVKEFTLTAQEARIGGQVAWTYNGTGPGPELRVTQGDRVKVTLVNHLPAATTLHWHGVAVPNAEDGVAGVNPARGSPGAR